jgi:glycosyltransferase involved in cell wall biosynthesis
VITPLGEGLIAREARDMGFTVDSLAKKRRFDLASIPRLAGLIRKHRIHILHSHEFNGAFYACNAGILARVTQVNSWHIPPMESFKQGFRNKTIPWLVFRYYLLAMRFCRRVITVSPELRQLVINGGVPGDKVRFIPTAIDLETYTPDETVRREVRAELGIPEDVTVIGTAGRIQRQKNLELFVQVARKLLDAGEKVRFMIVGDGTDRPVIEQAAAELGVARDVLVTGWRRDVPRVMQAFDIFALTSFSEGMPIVVLEAMALKKPVVGTDVGAMRQCVTAGETGLLVPSGDSEGLTRGLSGLLHDRDRGRRMGEAGRARVERDFTADAMVRRHLEVYAAALDQGKAAG